MCRRLKSPLFSGAKAEEKEGGERDSLKRTLGRRELQKEYSKEDYLGRIQQC